MPKRALSVGGTRAAKSGRGESSNLAEDPPRFNRRGQRKKRDGSASYEQAGHVHDHEADHDAGGVEGSGESAFGPARKQLPELIDHLQDGPRANREEERNPERRVREAADPRAQNGGHAGEQPEQNESANANLFLRERCDDPQSFGRVVQEEAEHEESAQRDLARSISGADREALTEIVQTDGESDQRGYVERRQRFLRAPSPFAERADCERSSEHAEKDQRESLERTGHARRVLEGFRNRINAEENEQPDREAEEKIHPLAVDGAQERQPQQSEQHGNDADVDAEHCEREDVARRWLGCLRRDRDFGLERETGAGHHFEIGRA